LQLLWGVFFSLNGFGKICCYNTALWNQSVQEVSWFSAVPQDLFVFIGICEFLGGIGLILPAMSRVKPELTPFAALGLTLVMALAAVFHIARGEYTFVPINLVLGGVATFIAYGRLSLRPIAPGSLSTWRAVEAVTVLAALVLVDAAPVLYRLTRIH
jgi:uncharacterized membrane protein YphA (DoxX/SURF4 family)